MTDDIFLDTLDKVNLKIKTNLSKLPQSKADRRHRNKIRRNARKAKKRELNLINKQNNQIKSGPVTVVYSAKIDFYQTDAWRELRYKVLVKFGATCQCCGATRKDGVVIHVDHIKPRSKFPELELVESNLQVLCAPCNLGKRNLDSTDWR